MQTFLPYASYMESAKCLDDRRLGKQRVEAYQILRILVGLQTESWQNHPAVRMWRGYEWSLFDYTVAVCREWRGRGFQDTVLDKLYSEIAPLLSPEASREKPAWAGNEEFHRSHRSNLLRKNPEHYGKFGWDVPVDLPYIWPI